MADFKHGKKTAVFYGEYDWSPVFTTANTTASTDPIDVTTFADAGANNLKSYGAGDRMGTASLSGMYTGRSLDLDPDQGAARTAAEPDELVKTWNDAGTDKPITVARNTTATTAAPNGFLVPNDTSAYVMNGIVSSWDVSSPVSDVVSMDLELQGTASSSNVIGGIPLPAKTIAHNYCDGTLTDTVSTTLVWNGVSTATQTDWVEVGANDNDYGAVICVHVLDNTVTGGTLSIVIQHATAGTGQGAGTATAEFGTDLLWTALAADTLGSKIVAYNPGANNTEGFWRLLVTPSAVVSGELSVLASVSILSSELFT